MSLLLTSLQNSRIKRVIKLGSRRQREAEQLTVVEGVREVSRALLAGIVPVEAFVCPELVAGNEEAETAVTKLQQLCDEKKTKLFTVTPELFQKMAYRGESGGLLLVIPFFARSLTELPDVTNPFYVVVAGGEKPGNIGAILRTADAAGITGLIVTSAPDEPATDVHNPNVIRASLGAAFTVPIAVAQDETAVSWLAAQSVEVVAAVPDAGVGYTAVHYNKPVAIVLGSEAWGLNQKWLQAATTHVSIPMRGIVDSLNLSVSAALMMYEVVRQRESLQDK
ncbi:MAG: RNA methyltransferase [Candidatus Thermofonsia bacterium]|nr:MAG: RNA methyltransferase [Candidatus Thermofonsia bacterium]